MPREVREQEKNKVDESLRGREGDEGTPVGGISF